MIRAATASRHLSSECMSRAQVAKAFCGEYAFAIKKEITLVCDAGGFLIPHTIQPDLSPKLDRQWHGWHGIQS